MTCEVTYEELSAFAAGDAAADRAQWLNEHVRHCSSCQARLDVLVRIENAMRKLPRIEPSGEAVLNVRRALSRGIRARAPEVMTLQEVADFLRISLEDLYETVDDMPAFELAGRILVRRAELTKWVEERERAYRRQAIRSELARGLAGTTQGD